MAAVGLDYRCARRSSRLNTFFDLNVALQLFAKPKCWGYRLSIATLVATGICNYWNF